MTIKPVLDHDYKPAILELRKFKAEVAKSPHKNFVAFAIERNDGYMYHLELDVFADGKGKDNENFFIVERLIKSILWAVGGFKIYCAGSDYLFEQLKKAYSKGGIRDFDYFFMARVYEKPFEVVKTTLEKLPKAKDSSIPAGGHLKGNRIGFDAGGSDRKVSAVVNGEAIFSEEVVWFPKTNTDPEYHYNGILEAMRTAASKFNGKIDAVGVSSAGIYVNNRIMVASLFIKVPQDKFDAHVKDMYINVVKQLEKELGYSIPLEVANDGDVTALAGAMELKDNNVLGIAMGTSEAAGYIDNHGNLKGWLNELAFCPVDFNPNSMEDEWSLDYGCGVKYFSQDAVIKLAPKAGIELDAKLSPAEKLKIVQKLNEAGDEGANKIFETIGVYLGYALAYYCFFYEIKHVLILGRVTSGKGGTTILEKAKETLYSEFPEYKNINIMLPDESNRRVGQSIAAASLPEVK